MFKNEIGGRETMESGAVKAIILLIIVLLALFVPILLICGKKKK